MSWHESWTAMQGLTSRDWLSRDEFHAAVRELVGPVTEWRIRRAVYATGRPEKRHGSYRYTREHVRAVRAYCERMGWIQEDQHGLADGRVAG